jgi:hypothetical protein
MSVDPRRLLALQMVVDALAHELAKAGDAEVDSALVNLRAAIKTTQDIVGKRGLYLQIPPDYVLPSSEGKYSIVGDIACDFRLQIPPDYDPPSGPGSKNPKNPKPQRRSSQ